MSDVFMSYSRKDRDSAQRLADVLSAQGWSIWWDRKIAAGAAFDEMIEHELDAAKCVLVLWSPSAVESEWVKNEAATALEREAIIPVLIENVRLPIQFRARQTIDLVGWDGSPEAPALAELIDCIATRLGGAPAPQAERGPSRPRTDSDHASRVLAPRRKSQTLWVLGAIGALAIAIATGVLLRNPPSAPETSAVADAPAAVDTIQTYTMTCKGGGPFSIRNDADGGVRIGFVPFDRPASDAMQPGQCSWSDRRLNENEPSDICDATSGKGRLVDDLAKIQSVAIHVHYESKTNCFRVVRFGSN
jgi:hypothetical protein